MARMSTDEEEERTIRNPGIEEAGRRGKYREKKENLHDADRTQLRSDTLLKFLFFFSCFYSSFPWFSGFLIILFTFPHPRLSASIRSSSSLLRVLIIPLREG
jgi:hypothetical protein